MSNYGPPGGTPPEPPSGDGTPPPPPAGYGTPPPPPPAGYGNPPQGGYGTPPPGGQPGAYGAPGPGQAVGFPRPAELLDRFLARLIDGVILGVVFGILFAILGAILIQEATYDFQTGQFDDGSSVLFYIVLSALTSLIYLGYYALLESSRGQTIGKQLVKLKVVGPDGVSNPTMEQAIRRNIWMAFGILGIVPIVGQLIGGLAQIAAIILIVVGINGDPISRQHWFDKFAGGTKVLKIG
jgi:uncharacterized RDD family membrane protein YckC